MSGLEVARHLQEDVHVSSTPILFLTGLVPETERLETSDSASQYIAKPFSPDLLAERVASALPGLSVAS